MMQGSEREGEGEGRGGFAERFEGVRRYKHWAWRRYQKLLDEATPHVTWRWVATGLLSVVFLLRIVATRGFFIIAYALGIYLLNLFIGFISPQVDPEGEGALPTSMAVDDEFRPFIRHLSEKKFWASATRALLISVACTFVPFLNIPVFWPILVIYFFGESAHPFACSLARSINQSTIHSLSHLMHSSHVCHAQELDQAHDQTPVLALELRQKDLPGMTPATISHPTHTTHHTPHTPLITPLNATAKQKKGGRENRHTKKERNETKRNGGQHGRRRGGH
jgi:hypothetical protein